MYMHACSGEPARRRRSVCDRRVCGCAFPFFILLSSSSTSSHCWGPSLPRARPGRVGKRVWSRLPPPRRPCQPAAGEGRQAAIRKPHSPPTCACVCMTCSAPFFLLFWAAASSRQRRRGGAKAAGDTLPFVMHASSIPYSCFRPTSFCFVCWFIEDLFVHGPGAWYMCKDVPSSALVRRLLINR